MLGSRSIRRVWIIFTHVYDWARVNQEQLFVLHLNHIGTQTHQTTDRRTSPYLHVVGGAG